MLVIFADPFLASLFARNLSGVFLSVSFCSRSSLILSEHLVLLVKSSWPARSLSERLVLLTMNRVKFTVSDETSTSFVSALDYFKRGKRLNPLTHWYIQVTGGGGKLRVPPSSTARGCLVQATALLRSSYVIVQLLALLTLLER